MIPGERLVLAVAAGVSFLPPDHLLPTVRTNEEGIARDYERGGAALLDATQGLDVQDWEFKLVGSTISVGLLGGTLSPLLTVVGVTEIAGAFDTNMNPCVAYVQEGVAKLWWYDTVDQAMVTTTFAGIASPRLALDDKRELQSASRDVLLLYLRGGSVWYRQQRDRYGIERKLIDAPGATRLRRVGMGTNGRVNVETLSLG